MFFRVLILLFILNSCSKTKNYESVQIIGHGGNGLEIVNSFYHDNTIESVELALSIEGNNGVEVDVQLSEDGELWLYHDDYLESETTGEGCINNVSNAYLETLTYKTWAKENLAKLSDLDWSQLENKQLYLDLRHYNFCSKQYVDVNKVVEKLQEIDLNNKKDVDLFCVVSTKLWIQPLLDAGFKVMITISKMENTQELFQQFPEVSGVVINNKLVNLADVEYLESLDKKVVIFEVRSPKGIRSALQKLPFGIMTDDIRTALIEKY